MGIKFDKSKVEGKKIGLALSGGAARGLAHIGVLRVLQNEGIPIDLIAGTSAGAIFGAAYAWNQDVNWITRSALDRDWKKKAPLLDPSFPKSGLLKGKKLKNLLSHYIGSTIQFSDLKIPFACVASDIDTGEEVVIDSGPVLEAIRASISIPGIFSVVKREGRYLVDGGLTTPVPVGLVKRMGADFIIAVNVNPDVSGRMGKTSKQRVEARKEPNIFQVMMQSIYITTYSLAWNSLTEADVIIEPDLANIGAGEFRRVRELITKGRQATEDAIPEIKRKLENL
jgi:NTE family protein